MDGPTLYTPERLVTTWAHPEHQTLYIPGEQERRLFKDYKKEGVFQNKI